MPPSPSTAFWDAANDTQPIILLTQGHLRQLIIDCTTAALTHAREHERLEQRVTSKRAAEILGCTPNHLQRLHKRGLAYEKGKPNFYRLGDIEALRADSRLHRTA